MVDLYIMFDLYNVSQAWYWLVIQLLALNCGVVLFVYHLLR